MNKHTSQEQQTFREDQAGYYKKRFCKLCNVKYVPTGARQEYCLLCQRVKKKERVSRYNKKRYQREKVWKVVENQLRGLGIKPGDNFQICLANGDITVRRLPTSQPK